MLLQRTLQVSGPINVEEILYIRIWDYYVVFVAQTTCDHMKKRRLGFYFFIGYFSFNCIFFKHQISAQIIPPSPSVPNFIINGIEYVISLLELMQKNAKKKKVDVYVFYYYVMVSLGLGNISMTKRQIIFCSLGLWKCKSWKNHSLGCKLKK